MKRCNYDLDAHPEIKIGLYAVRKFFKNVSTIGETLLGISSSFTDSMMNNSRSVQDDCYLDRNVVRQGVIANVASLMLSKQVEKPLDVLTTSKSLADSLVVDSKKRITEFPLDIGILDESNRKKAGSSSIRYFSNRIRIYSNICVGMKLFITHKTKHPGNINP
jgi:hypothetical protein